MNLFHKILFYTKIPKIKKNTDHYNNIQDPLYLPLMLMFTFELKNGAKTCLLKQP